MKTLYPLECHFAEILTLTDTAMTRFLPCLQHTTTATRKAAILLFSKINGTQYMRKDARKDAEVREVSAEVMTFTFEVIFAKKNSVNKIS